MDKVVCPACGLVNLEKFVTYPHCAACGELLTHAAPPRLAFWRRPVSALLWATALGLCCAALGVAGILTARETQHSEARRLVVYVQVPRRLSAGQTGKIQIGLDDLEMGAGAGAAFDEVQLRLPRDLLENFVLVSVQPTPQNRIQRHNGTYFDFGSLTRDQNLFISLRPRRAGLRDVEFSIYARDFLPYRWNSNLNIEPGPTFPRPTSLRPALSASALSASALSASRADSFATRQTGR